MEVLVSIYLLVLQIQEFIVYKGPNIYDGKTSALLWDIFNKLCFIKLREQ